jgi:cytochrome P450
MRNQVGYSERMVARYGPVYRGNTFFRRSISAVSPDAVQLLLRDPERIFSSTWGWDNLIGRFFPRGLMLRDFGDHKVHRRVMQSVFKTSALRKYLDLMSPVIADAVAAWGDAKRFRYYPAAKRLTLDLAGVVFTGLPVGEGLSRTNRAFVDMMAATFVLMRLPIPGTRYWRGLRGRAHLETLFRELIPKKRDSDDPDMLAHLCHAESEEGERLTDDEIIDHMIFLMLAAHDTTTSALTNVVWGLAAHPEWQERLRESFMKIDAESLGYDDLARLGDVDLVLKETLRLYPPVTAIPRLTLRECEIDGVRIPANAVVWLLPTITHRLPEYWTDPDAFDPERFSDERAEHKQHPGLWYPYSGGVHICIGMLFAIVQVKAVLNQMLRRYQLELPPGYAPKRQLVPFPKPMDDLPLILKKIGPATRYPLPP